MTARGTLRYVVIDCIDPEALAAFWAELLGVEIAGRFGEGTYVFLEAASDGAPRFAFQRVPEPKIAKNRVHVDLTVDDLEAVTSWLESHGGERASDHEEDGYRWRVALDPEGNELCLVPPAQD